MDNDNPEGVVFDEDVIGLGYTRELFVEREEVLALIDQAKTSALELNKSEVALGRFIAILDQYQEQPHLLDPHLDDILGHIVSAVREYSASGGTPQPLVLHQVFSYLYIVAKVRKFKVLLRHLPHEVADLEPLLALLEAQDPFDRNKWEIHYGLLLWLCIVVQIPFHLTRLDTGNMQKPTMSRILDICRKFLEANTKAQDIASYLSAIYLTRPDVKEVHLLPFLLWCLQVLASNVDISRKKGILMALAGLFKHGKREDLLPHASVVLRGLLVVNFSPSELSIVRRAAVKLSQRIGLTFLRTRLASWRYQRGSRSLAVNLYITPGNDAKRMSNADDFHETQDEEEMDVPEEVEEVLEDLLNALRDKDRRVQWSGAKGLGRITSRLPKSYGDQLVGWILDIFTPTESDMAWHGGCLALAELARRGLLLPSRLPAVFPVLAKCLVFEELRGSFSVGACVRDAACYVAWAFARAYQPSVLQPYVQDLARSLMLTAVLDREVQCRRAAAAAFQEHVGRQGTFPYGIDIVTQADYFAVGIRKYAYLEISCFVAQYPEYRESLILHILDTKVSHWDVSIRELAAQALNRLTALDVGLITERVLPQVIKNVSTSDLYLKHGSVLALGEILLALSELSISDGKTQHFLGNDLLQSVYQVGSQVCVDKFLRGLGSDMMKQAISTFIRQASMAHLPMPDESLLGTWQRVLEENLSNADINVQSAAVQGLSALLTEYGPEMDPVLQETILKRYVAQLKSYQPNTRSGFSLALGQLPGFLLQKSTPAIIESLILCGQISEQSLMWAESRRDALKALSSILKTLGSYKPVLGGVDEKYVKNVFEAFLQGLQDYTIDKRGDIGAMVREASMAGIQTVVEVTCELNLTHVFTPNLSLRIMSVLAKQAVEPIQRTRMLAGQVFSNLLYSQPPLPNIPDREKVQSLFPEGEWQTLNWGSEKETFPRFVQLLSYPNYLPTVLLGFVTTVGGLTESLVRNAGAPLWDYLRSLRAQGPLLEDFCQNVLSLWERNLADRRIVPLLVQFLQQFLASGISDDVLESNEAFGGNLLRIMKAEAVTGAPLKVVLSYIDLYCQLLHATKETATKALTQLSILLCYKYPRVRNATASKLYEALITYSDKSLVPEEQLEAVLNLLSETSWDEDVEKIRPIRNELCQLMNIPAPIRVKK